MYEDYYMYQGRSGMSEFAAGLLLKEPSRHIVGLPEGIKRFASTENILNQSGSGRKHDGPSVVKRAKHDDDDDMEEGDDSDGDSEDGEDGIDVDDEDSEDESDSDEDDSGIDDEESNEDDEDDEVNDDIFE